ncbi:MAG: serine/threonine protein kinase [Cyanobacteria bacterium REEB67]|nr:serine/threonine protein kinase [Cyanobacteria bacterium REEB67]
MTIEDEQNQGTTAGGTPAGRLSSISRRFWNLRNQKPGTTFAELRRSAHPQGNIDDAYSVRLQEGAIVGGAYKIIKLIGHGGMGEVYLAEHQTLRKLCAIKLIAPEQVTDLSWKRFQQEAKAIANIEHINLVKVTDLGIHKGYLPYYAMEFVEGETLEDLVARTGPMPLARALEIFLQVCDGVDYAHHAGIIHRDIKPANIMVADHGGKLAVKILDFGLAKLTTKDRERQSLTMVGDVFGSPYYMSPEQCNGEKVDNRSDIYSIGCALFESLTGRPPFIGNLAAAVIFCHQESEPPSLASVGGGKKFPESIEIVIAKTLRKSPRERYQSCRELIADLKKVSRNEEVLPVYVSRGAPARSTSGASGAPRATKAKQGPALAPHLSSKSAVGDDLRTILAIGGVISVFLVCCLGWYFINLKTSSPMPAARLYPQTGNALDEATSFKAVQEADDPRKFSGFRLTQQVDKHYSQIVTIRGRKVISFDFPTGSSLGLLSDGKTAVQATGNVLFSYPSHIVFEPAQNVLVNPDCLTRFRAGDLEGIDLTKVIDIDAAVQAMCRLPGYLDLKILRIGSLLDDQKVTISTWEILNRLKAPEIFTLEGWIVRPHDVARFGWLLNIRELELAGIEDCAAILPVLKKSCNLKRLRLACNLNQRDLENIAAFPSLEELDIDSGVVHGNKLSRLSTAPVLRTLALPAAILADPTLSQVLSTFPHLRRVNFGRLSADQIATLEKIKLPYVTFHYAGPSGIKP